MKEEVKNWTEPDSIAPPMAHSVTAGSNYIYIEVDPNHVDADHAAHAGGPTVCTTLTITILVACGNSK